MQVKIEVLLPKYGPPQCFRCQGFFHSSKFCTRTPRCVKCADEHLAKDCTKPLEQKPKCCLCEGEHPAIFLGCPKKQSRLKERQQQHCKKCSQDILVTCDSKN
ncbi:nucleic-acid-binding protein from transposon X-element [Trichonephila clavata]|uniref:Nucleic-acid-binding protein from transposon X-element n=1 Tax=Trichonephila clavata TaxID=2740835 RepID=A0A8X6HBI7_TRICU|nr:nucleic-acid-binding protein from transposon X-element [Trichonephila clavata]